jgi:hypothetical protein
MKNEAYRQFPLSNIEIEAKIRFIGVLVNVTIFYNYYGIDKCGSSFS